MYRRRAILALLVLSTFWLCRPPAIRSAHAQNNNQTVIAKQATGSNLHVVIDSGTVTSTSSTTTYPASPPSNAAGTTGVPFYTTSAGLLKTSLDAFTAALPTGANTIGSVNIVGTVPVSGTFWQATQPVSGTFWQGTQPVSGTFWQATQPVSIASMPTTPVTGTFWQATQPVSGTVTANAGTNLNTSALALDATLTNSTQKTQVVQGGNTLEISATGAVSQQGDFTEYTGLSAGSLNADLLTSTDVSAFKWFSVQTLGTWTGTLTFQGSNDNSTFVSTTAFLINETTGTSRSSSTTTNIYAGNISFRYLRIRMTAYTSGTATGVVELYTTPAPAQYINVAAVQAGTWTVQPGNTANTTAWKVDGSAVTQPVSGTVTVNQAASATGGYSFSHIATNTTTTIKSGAGTLRTLIINTRGVGNTATIYDNTAGSGTVIAILDTTLSTTSFVYDVAFSTGLTVVTSGGTAPDLTFSYK